MKVEQIMRTNGGPERLSHTIRGDTDILTLRSEALVAEARYEVVDADGGKMGEISGDRLLFLSESAARLDLNEILNCIEDGVVVVDREGRICYENDSYARIVGVPMRKTLGKNLHTIEPDALLLQVLKSGEPSSRKRHLIKSVGKYVSMRMYPILKGGAVEGAFSVFRDVTELNQLGQEVRRMTGVAAELSSQLEAELAKFQIVGKDVKIRNLISRAITAAGTDATVLIRGENGVGKEGFAKLIHQASHRRDKPLITVNCAAIPPTLIESELFGYEEGSFTGAKRGGKVGKFELARGGTLFLDEIGDMPLLMQSKLLRVLQEGEIEKIGREETIPVDVRVVAATNQPLEELITKKRFREDLYYRLNVVALAIPPLRERRDDILLLARHFLDRYNEKYGKSVGFSRAFCEGLLADDWPGNVRQLQNCIESAVIMCSEEEIGPDALPVGRGGPERPVPVEGLMRYGMLKEEAERFERGVIQAVLGQCGGDHEEAARRLGVSRRTLYRKLEGQK